MPFRSRPLLAAAWVSVFLCARAATADTLKITSNPAGASVEIEGVAVGTTPYEEKLPGGYFTGPGLRWVRSSNTQWSRVSALLATPLRRSN